MNTTDQKVNVIQRVSNSDAKNLAEKIGVETGVLLLCLNGLFDNGIYLCQFSAEPQETEQEYIEPHEYQGH